MTGRVSVIIPVHTLERWPDIVAAVGAVREQTVAPEEVIVVVDGNPELAARARAELPGARVLDNAQAPGANGARNTAAEQARGEVIAFLDDDAVPEPRWLEEHLSAYADPNVIGTGGTMRPRWRGGHPDRLPPELWWIIGCTWTGTPAGRAPIRNAVSANMTIRADVLARTGGFLGSLGRLNRPGAAMAGTADETELCIRAAALHPGGYFLQVPTAVVDHAVPAGRTTWSYILARSRLEGRAKATVVDRVGAGAGLASERSYVRSVIPRALVRELRGAAAGRGGALERAGALVLAVGATGAAYGRARLSRAGRAGA